VPAQGEPLLHIQRLLAGWRQTFTSIPVPSAVSVDVASICAARTDLNAALVSRDLAAISKYWLQEAQSVFAGGEVKVGRPEIMARYAAIFKSGNFISGLRTPERIEVATGGPREAAESGHWEWRMRQSGQELLYRPVLGNSIPRIAAKHAALRRG
jgi:hypothetical protein